MQQLTLSSCTSLSIPRGPSVVLTVSVTAIQAFMLLISCAVPWLVSVPSLSRMIWGCCNTNQEHSEAEFVNGVTILQKHCLDIERAAIWQNFRHTIDSNKFSMWYFWLRSRHPS